MTNKIIFRFNPTRKKVTGSKVLCVNAYFYPQSEFPELILPVSVI